VTIELLEHLTRLPSAVTAVRCVDLGSRLKVHRSRNQELVRLGAAAGWALRTTSEDVPMTFEREDVRRQHTIEERRLPS